MRSRNTTTQPQAPQPIFSPFRRRSSDRRKGSYFLEYSLAFWPLFIVMLGIIDFAIPIFIRSAFINAAREGVRYGITYNYVSGKTHSQSIRQKVVDNSCGFLSGQTGLDMVVVRFYSAVTFVEVTSGVKNADGNIVEVSIEGFTWNWIVPLWRNGSPLVYTIRAADRLETLPRNATRPTA